MSPTCFSPHRPTRFASSLLYPKKGITYSGDYLFSYLLGWRQFDIQPTDTVLEVGSGGHPLIRSDILCDKFVFSSYERFLNLPVVMDRPFVAADAEHLPFRDKSIDFLYCTDLAEHLPQPHNFLNECMRVANKGVIITPSVTAERMFGWDYHAVMYEVQGKNSSFTARPAATGVSLAAPFMISG